MTTDDTSIVRKLRMLPEDASLQDRLDVMLGREVDRRDLLDGTVVKPQQYRSIVVTGDKDRSVAQALGENIEGALRGTGRLVRDAAVGAKDTTVDVYGYDWQEEPQVTQWKEEILWLSW